MNRRQFVLSTAAALSAQPARPPNIVLIVADDLGYGELGCYGNKDIPTPHIDSLAANGVRFTNGYVSCPVCSPTRAGLLTGRYQQRFGHEFNPGPVGAEEEAFGLPLGEVTLAERLKKLGYATGMVGKWHLGNRPELQPTSRGFDFFFGFLGGAHSYVDANAAQANPILRGAQRVPRIEYTTHDFAREAVAFIAGRRDQPFFLYLPFNAVHAPMQATARDVARFAHIADPRRRTFAGMLAALDDAVGQALAKLRAEKLEERTLIFFLSDNGGPTAQTTSSNGPLRGVKGQVYEGGIRVPFLIQWKGRLPAGHTYQHPVIALDIHATAVAAAGGAPGKNLDGVDLLPFLGENRPPPHEALFWRFGPQAAARVGDWKLVMPPRAGPQLFHLADDVGEAKDLAAAEPQRVQQLRAAYDAWNVQMAPPKWRRRESPKPRRQRVAGEG
jgi:arylsulfatase A-like enzyme